METLIKSEVKEAQEYFTYLNGSKNIDFGACLHELVTDSGNTVLEWRVERSTNKMCIIEFSSRGHIIFKS